MNNFTLNVWMLRLLFQQDHHFPHYLNLRIWLFHIWHMDVLIFKLEHLVHCQYTLKFLLILHFHCEISHNQRLYNYLNHTRQIYCFKGLLSRVVIIFIAYLMQNLLRIILFRLKKYFINFTKIKKTEIFFKFFLSTTLF